MASGTLPGLFNTLSLVASFALLWVWQTGLIHRGFRDLLILLHLAGRWYLANASRTIPATVSGIVALWLANLFAAVPTTRVLMEFAFGRLGMFVFYMVIVGLGVLLGAGIIEFKRPFDR